MKRLSLVCALGIFSLSAYAEKCEGINACANLYSKLTGAKVFVSESVSDEMSLGMPETDLNNENARSEFPTFLNKNVVHMKGDTMVADRSGEFLTAPIYEVSMGNMPQMINKDGAVTLVYHSKKDPKKLVSAKIKSMLTPKGKHGATSIYSETKIIALGGTFENVTKAMTAVMKADK